MKTRTYQDLDPDAPLAARYLCVLTAGKASILIHEASAEAAQTKAEAWWAEERRKAGIKADGFKPTVSAARKAQAKKPGRPKKPAPSK